MIRYKSISIVDKALKEMHKSIKDGKSIYQPSKYWEMLNEENLDQLKKFGITNFKQHQALNYFTFLHTLKREDNDQFIFLFKNSPLTTLIKCLVVPCNLSKKFNDSLSIKTKWYYQIFVRLLWEYTLRFDKDKILNLIKEPLLGNPFPVIWRKRLISQDLSNSVLEYYSILEASGRKKSDFFTCAELGGGYGRNAYVFFNNHPNIRYIMVDVPPALLIAQEYLSRLFPQKKIFKFRNFDNYKKIQNEFESSRILFLTPPQLELLPKKSINLFLTISTLHEMRLDQIDNYLKNINRLTCGVFYMKQWKIGYVVMEDVYIREEDYPIPKNWHLIYSREAKVQTKFFEKAYRIN